MAKVVRKRVKSWGGRKCDNRELNSSLLMDDMLEYRLVPIDLTTPRYTWCIGSMTTASGRRKLDAMMAGPFTPRWGMFDFLPMLYLYGKSSQI